MKRMIIDLFDEEDGDLNGLIKINSDELSTTYLNTSTSHGLHCNLKAGSNNFVEIRETLEDISTLIRKINSLYKSENSVESINSLYKSEKPIEPLKSKIILYKKEVL